MHTTELCMQHAITRQQGKRVELVNRAATGIRGMLYFLGTNQPETFLLPEKDNLQCFNFVMCDPCDRIVI